MMRLFVNGLAASAGGGLTYLRNVIPHLSARADVETTVAVSRELKQEFGDLPRVSFATLNAPSNALRRFWQEQTLLPNLLRESRSDVLLSAGNFALRRSPVPQILLSRNSLYTSPDFYRDLRTRGEYRMWLDTKARGLLAKRSLGWAERTVAPSQAFADDLRRWSGVEVVAIHHGFDRDYFFADNTPLSAEVRGKLEAAENSLRLLFVSHYNYYRNFETLLRALPELKRALSPREVKLVLTCDFSQAQGYSTENAARLVRELGIELDVVELGPVRYHALHRLYAACDIYVTAAYTETFAHPLVEAMASGLPIVASDLPVHREICQSAALYFPRFSFQELAQHILQISSSVEMRESVAGNGRRRFQSFSWRRHTDQLIELAEGLSPARGPV